MKRNETLQDKLHGLEAEEGLLEGEYHRLEEEHKQLQDDVMRTGGIRILSASFDVSLPARLCEWFAQVPLIGTIPLWVAHGANNVSFSRRET